MQHGRDTHLEPSLECHEIANLCTYNYVKTAAPTGTATSSYTAEQWHLDRLLDVNQGGDSSFSDTQTQTATKFTVVVSVVERVVDLHQHVIVVVQQVLDLHQHIIVIVQRQLDDDQKREFVVERVVDQHQLVVVSSSASSTYTSTQQQLIERQRDDDQAARARRRARRRLTQHLVVIVQRQCDLHE